MHDSAEVKSSPSTKFEHLPDLSLSKQADTLTSVPAIQANLPLRPAIFLIIIFSLMLLGCSEPKQSNSLQQVLDRGVLKVGTSYGATTYYHGAQGPQGFEYELAAGFANYLGVRLEVYPFHSLGELFPKLEQDRIDIIAAAMITTPQRAEEYRFGPSYQRVSQKLVYKQGVKRPREIEDLSGSLTVVADSSYAETLRVLKQQHQELKWQESEDKDAEELMEMVLNGEIDYTIADSNILSVVRRRQPNLSIGFTIHQEQDVGWLIDKDSDDSLYAAMIEYFGSIHADGSLAVLRDKYFGHVRSFNFVDARAFIEATKTKLPQYQAWFEGYAQNIDWRLLAAMAYQESHWKPDAVSPTGVKGMMMLTLATAKELGIASRLDPEQSIRGGAEYYAKLIKRIPARIQQPDRSWFALAAYNVGLGHLEDARKLTQAQGADPDLWVEVKKRLPLLRQKKYYKNTQYGYARGHEAVSYVDNIRRYYDTLVWLDAAKQEQLAAEQTLTPPQSSNSESSADKKQQQNKPKNAH